MKKVFSIFLVVTLLLCNGIIAYADDGVHGIYVGIESEPQEPREHNPQTGLYIQNIVVIFVVVFVVSILVTLIILHSAKKQEIIFAPCKK